jgi:hypothetical protein
LLSPLKRERPEGEIERFLFVHGATHPLALDPVLIIGVDDRNAVYPVAIDPTIVWSPFAGAAYVFVRAGTVWSQQTSLKVSNTGEPDVFGISVSIHLAPD